MRCAALLLCLPLASCAHAPESDIAKKIDQDQLQQAKDEAEAKPAEVRADLERLRRDKARAKEQKSSRAGDSAENSAGVQ